MNLLIVDDEPLARAHLRRLLERLGETVSGEAEDATEALQMAETLRPDVVFLDIQMPGISGMQLAAALQSLDGPPLIVFVTGYSEHALAAFERNALDYLVKPVSPERLAKSLARARERLADRTHPRGTRSQTSDARTGDQSDQNEPRIPELSPLSRLPVREDYTVRFIRVEEILCAVARDKRVVIRTAEGEMRTYYTLSQLGTLLPADRFLRIHDSCIVNVEQIQELHSLGSHSYSVSLTNGLQLPVSRSRYPVLQQRLHLSLLPTS